MGASKGQIYQPRDAHLYLAPDRVDVGTLRSQVCVALCPALVLTHLASGAEGVQLCHLFCRLSD